MLPAVHAVLMWSQRSPLLLSNLHLQHAAFGPVFLCPHEGKHVSTSLYISLGFSLTLLPPGCIKVVDVELAKLKLEKHGGCDLWQPFLPFINVPPSKSQNCPTATNLLHRCDINSSFFLNQRANVSSKQVTGCQATSRMWTQCPEYKVIFLPVMGVCFASVRASLLCVFGFALSAHVNMFPGFSLLHRRCELIL